jgi:hypothetical protein
MSVVHVVGEPTLEKGTSAACGADRQPADPIDTWGTPGQAADVFGCDSEVGLVGLPPRRPPLRVRAGEAHRTPVLAL